MNDTVSPGPPTLDNGQAFRIGGDGGPAFLAAVCACPVPGCPCTEVELHLTPDADASGRPDDAEEGAEPARITIDLATREVTRIVDPAGVLAGDHGEAWIRGEVAGVVGARVAARVARARAQKDRSTWQAYDWARHESGDMVHHDEIFPHDWDLVIVTVIGGQTVWFSDLYCVRPECACQELALTVHVLDPDGAWSPGDVRVRLGAKNTVEIISCDRDAARFAEPFLAIPDIACPLGCMAGTTTCSQMEVSSGLTRYIRIAADSGVDLVIPTGTSTIELDAPALVFVVAGDVTINGEARRGRRRRRGPRPVQHARRQRFDHRRRERAGAVHERHDHAADALSGAAGRALSGTTRPGRR